MKKLLVCVLCTSLLAMAGTLKAGNYEFTIVVTAQGAADEHASLGGAKTETNCDVAGVNCNAQGASAFSGSTNYQTPANRFDAEVDGEGKRFLLTCSGTCIHPVKGQSYQAEVKGSIMWLSISQDSDSKKMKRVKYKIAKIVRDPSSCDPKIEGDYCPRD